MVYSCTQTRQARTHNTTAAAARYRDVDMMNLYVLSQQKSDRVHEIINYSVTPVQLAQLAHFCLLRCVALLIWRNATLKRWAFIISFTVVTGWPSCLPVLVYPSLPLFPDLLLERGEERVLCVVTMSAKFPMGIGLECGRLHLSLGPPCAG